MLPYYLTPVHGPASWAMLAGKRDILVWRVDFRVGCVLDALALSDLSSMEQIRLASFRQFNDRLRFAATRLALRQLLGQALGIPASSVPLYIDKMGKPKLGIGAPLSFNVSHSGSYALVALSYHGQIGVDIEAIRSDIKVGSIAQQAFSQREIAYLERTDESGRITLFYTLWTCKEAILKALGLGIAEHLASFSVLPEDGKIRLRAEMQSMAFDVASVAVSPLAAPLGYAAAIALVRPLVHTYGQSGEV